MTFWLYVLFSILLKCNFSHINFVHYLVAKVPIHFRIKLMTLSYVWDNAPLFEEDFIASELASGVINKTISHYFKDYFKWLIEIPEKYGCIPVAMTEEEKETLEIV